MKKYDKILTDAQKNPLLQMIEMGRTPDEIKEAVIDSLSPYFENKDILEKNAINLLVTESINLLKLKRNSWYFDYFEKCLLTFRSAKIKDSHACFESCAYWQNEIKQSVSEHWSLYYLEIQKNTLENEEYVFECLRNMGAIIEGLIKPYSKVFIHNVRIANGVKTTSYNINSLSFGKIVNELIKKSDCSDLFVLTSKKIKLNQWRNIAYHHSARIENNEVICWYGKSSNLQYIRFTKEDLLQIVHDIYKIYAVLTLAHTLFFVDNINEILKFSPPDEVRDEADFLNFIVGLNSQGFEIVKFDKNNNEAILVIRDVSKMPPLERLSHVSQFIFQLWIITHSNQLIIEYYDNKNTPCFRLSSNSEMCEKVYNGDLDELVLPKTMEIIDLKSNEKLKPSIDD